MTLKLLLIQLNEINFDIVSKYIKIFPDRFPGFKNLFEGISTNTKAEEEYSQLEPWIQWASVHTGKSYNEHKIFRLGDIVNSNETSTIMVMIAICLVFCFVASFCVFLYYKRRRMKEGINNDGKTPYERWMNQLELNGQRGDTTLNSPNVSTHSNPIDRSINIVPPPPPTKNPLPRPSRVSTRFPSQNYERPRKSLTRDSGSMYNMYSHEDKVESTSNPLH